MELAFIFVAALKLKRYSSHTEPYRWLATSIWQLEAGTWVPAGYTSVLAAILDTSIQSRVAGHEKRIRTRCAPNALACTKLHLF